MKIVFSNSRGQSIIELLVAITILSMVLVSVTLMSTKSIQLSQSSTYREKAISLVKSEIEEIRLYKDTCDWEEFVEINPNCWKGYSNGEKSLGEEYVANIVIDEDSGIATVNFTVSWEDFKGEHEIEQNLTFNK